MHAGWVPRKKAPPRAAVSSANQLHFSPQIEPASLTQIESQRTLQQYGSSAQSFTVHASHPSFSRVPVVQSVCLHVLPPPPLLLPELPPELLPLLLPELLLLLVPELLPELPPLLLLAVPELLPPLLLPELLPLLLPELLPLLLPELLLLPLLLPELLLPPPVQAETSGVPHPVGPS